MTENDSASFGTEVLRCSDCGEEFDDVNARMGRTGSPVYEREEFTCPNGHRAVKNYDIEGNLTQQWGIQR